VVENFADQNGSSAPESWLGVTMRDAHHEESSDSERREKDVSDALASLSLSTELDSALLDHLNLLDKYMFHVECLSQLFRLVSSSTLLPMSYFRHSLSWLKRIARNLLPEPNELDSKAMINACKQ